MENNKNSELIGALIKSYDALLNVGENNLKNEEVISIFKSSYEAFLEAITIILSKKMALFLPSAVFDIAQTHSLITDAHKWKVMSSTRSVIVSFSADKMIGEVKALLPFMIEEFRFLIKHLEHTN